MPLTIACPGCKAKLKAPDALLGKTVKCPQCSQAIQVKAPASAPAAPAPAPAPAVRQPAPAAVKKKAVEELPPAADDFDDYEEEERKPARPARGKARVEEPDDDEVDEVDEVERKAPGGRTNAQEQTQAMLIYVIGLLLGPLFSIILWLIKRKESRFVDHHGKQYINFTITVFLEAMLVAIVGMGLGVAVLLALRLTYVGIGIIIISGLILTGLGLWSFVLTIMAALKAKKGEWYRIPGTLRLLK